MSDRNNDFGAFLVGFLAGGITGAIVALLFAPQTGEETRTMIREKAIELSDEASKTVGETLSRAEKTASEAIKQAEEALKKAKAQATDLAKKGQVLLEEQKEKLVGKKPKEDKSSG